MTCRYSLGELSALTCYSRGCREDTCRDTGNRYQQQRRKASFDGLAPAAPVRAHIGRLTAGGMRLQSIADVTGLYLTHVSIINRGRCDRVTAVTAAAIMSVQCAPDFHAPIDAAGTRRRLQALAFVGWDLVDIAARVGIGHEGLRRIRAGKAHVEVGTAQAVASVYDALWQTPPPMGTPTQRRKATAVKGLAGRKGWAPPLAWDDDTISDPKAKPSTGRSKANRKVIVDEVAIERLKRGQRVDANKVELRQAIASLSASGLTTQEVADRLGMEWSAVKKARERIYAAERKTA